LGFPIVVYLDDGFATAVDYERCEKMSLQVQNDLLSSGFIVIHFMKENKLVIISSIF
jgi:hypothetical protein